jgi:hypothetical protein
LNEIDQCLEELEHCIDVYSLFSIDKYIQYAKEHDLITQYFPVVDSGFIVYKDKTIFLTSEKVGTKLSIRTI